MIEQLLQADRLLIVDQVPQARAMYARVVELDPGNAIAVVGLARCALADGDDRDAYDLAAQALRIDPENDMARRMEARLAEILAERGEPTAHATERGLEPLKPSLVKPEPVKPGSASTEPVTPNPETLEPESLTPASPEPVMSAPRSFLDRLRGR